MSLKRVQKVRRAVLPPVQYDPHTDESAIEVLGTHTFEFPDRRSFTINASPYGEGRLASELLTALARYAKRTGSGRYGTLKGRDGSIRVFCRQIQKHQPGALSISDLTGDDLSWWESHLATAYPTGRTARTHFTSISSLLREATAFTDLQESLKYRIHQGATQLSEDATPREAYTETELTLIKEAAMRVHLATRERLVTNPVEVNSLGADEQHLLGKLAAGSEGFCTGTAYNRLNKAKAEPARLPFLIHPSPTDLLAIVVLLLVETGWNPSVVLDLRVDCLVNPTSGRVGVQTVKRRRGSVAQQVLYVRDGGPLSPGGLIRTAITITEGLRVGSTDPTLWLSWRTNPAGVKGPHSLAAKKYVRALFREAGVTLGAAGFPDVQLVRIRKTVQLRRYRDSHGSVGATQGHSRDVGARHYANLPSMVETHLKALRAGLAEVLSLTSTKRDTAAESLPDTFTTACRDAEASPYYPAGQTCLADPSLCLGCPNSVIALRHLPGILHHAELLADEAQTLPAEEWTLAHGTTWLRIHDSILPQFSPNELEAAAAPRGRPLLPLHVKAGPR